MGRGVQHVGRGDLVALTLVTVLIGRVSTRLLCLSATGLALLNAPVLAGASALPALVLGLAVCWPAAGGVSPRVQLAVSSTVLGVLLLIMGGRLPDEEVAAERRRRSLRHRFAPQLVLLAAVAFLASFVEGAASQWSSVFTADYLDEGAALGAATYTCFTVAILVGRLVGDRFVSRWGRRVFVQVSLLTVVLGAGVGLVHPGLPYALAGATSLRLALASLAVAGLGAALLTRRISMA
ncbi:hypothetical protein OG588_39195 [Streptomyces prunicolor]|uniref:hypothetical protein n=1 Tax=Streptomyces prunicolor TaxID=67348 RepID=UPI003868C680|nr:hypothetical protein OG588_39195 [Streptomyces prunicolor]